MRFRCDLDLVIELSAVDDVDASRKLAAIRAFVVDRLKVTTFARLPGRPSVELVAILEDTIAAS